MASTCENCGIELLPYDGYPLIDCVYCGSRNQVHCTECSHWEKQDGVCGTCEEASEFEEVNDER